MSNEMPDIGKISPEIFNELIFPRLGAMNKDLLVGPQNGVDVGIVEIGGVETAGGIGHNDTDFVCIIAPDNDVVVAVAIQIIHANLKWIIYKSGGDVV